MIRRATSEDISSMLALQKSVEDENAIWGYSADPQEVWAKRDLAWTWVAVREAQLIGFVYCTPQPYVRECVFPADGRILEIVELIVAIPERSRNFGHQLLETVECQARAEGFTHLRVYSAAKRFDDILRFYRSCGFVPWYLEMTKEIES